MDGNVQGYVLPTARRLERFFGGSEMRLCRKGEDLRIPSDGMEDTVCNNILWLNTDEFGMDIRKDDERVSNDKTLGKMTAWPHIHMGFT